MAQSSWRRNQKDDTYFQHHILACTVDVLVKLGHDHDAVLMSEQLG